MLRQGQYKYIYYEGFAPELFNLKTDPEEVNDLAGEPEMNQVLDNFLAKLNEICDPVAIDQQAKKDQLALIALHGGARKILARGGSSYTPIPGEEVRLISTTP
jgi:choline-sulfatase